MSDIEIEFVSHLTPARVKTDASLQAEIDNLMAAEPLAENLQQRLADLRAERRRRTMAKAWPSE